MTDPQLPIEILPARTGDLAEISALHARAFGPGRFARTAYRIREAVAGAPVSPHCRVARDAGGRLAGAVTMTAVSIDGAAGHWLLGPLATLPELAGQGIGRRLVRTALQSIASDGAPEAVTVLVGDLKYYAALGFAPAAPGAILLPGPADPARILVWRGPAQDRTAPAGLVRAGLG